MVPITERTATPPIKTTNCCVLNQDRLGTAGFYSTLIDPGDYLQMSATEKAINPADTTSPLRYTPMVMSGQSVDPSLKHQGQWGLKGFGVTRKTLPDM